MSFEVAAHEAVGRHGELQRRGGGIVDARGAVLARERKDSLDAANAGFLLARVDRAGEDPALVETPSTRLIVAIRCLAW
jgi:hypothetical protein